MKDQKPELEHIEICVAKSGEKLKVKIASFKEPIFPHGDVIHVIARVEDESGNLWQYLVGDKPSMAIAFYPDPMDAEELEEKCLEIVENLEKDGIMLNLKKQSWLKQQKNLSK